MLLTVCCAIDGSLLVLSPMDPLFVLLHAVHRSTAFASLYDLLAQQRNVWWLQLKTVAIADVASICDVQSEAEEALDNVCVKPNETKILQWLSAKVSGPLVLWSSAIGND